MGKAFQIADSGSIIQQNANCWKVNSEKRKGKQHTINVTESGMSCSCLDQQEFGVCEHGKAVEILILKQMDKVVGFEQLLDVKLQCPKCNETDVQIDKRTKYDILQHFKCKCGYRFSNEVELVKRHLPSIILLAMNAFSCGASYESISTRIHKKNKLHIHYRIIQMWIERHSVFIDRDTQELSIRDYQAKREMLMHHNS